MSAFDVTLDSVVADCQGNGKRGGILPRLFSIVLERQAGRKGGRKREARDRWRDRGPRDTGGGGGDSFGGGGGGRAIAFHPNAIRRDRTLPERAVLYEPVRVRSVQSVSLFASEVFCICSVLVISLASIFNRSRKSRCTGCCCCRVSKCPFVPREELPPAARSLVCS